MTANDLSFALGAGFSVVGMFFIVVAIVLTADVFAARTLPMKRWQAWIFLAVLWLGIGGLYCSAIKLMEL